MSTTFNFGNVEVNEGSTYITPGVYDTVIAEVSEGTMPYGDNIPGLTIKFETTDGKASHTENFSLDRTVKEGKTKSLFDWTQQRIKHLGTKIVTDEEFNKISSVAELNAALLGRQVRIKFGGKEYLNAEGQKKVTTKLPFMYFAESISVNPSRMKYDENSKFDFERIDAPEQVTATNTEATTSDLPF